MKILQPGVAHALFHQSKGEEGLFIVVQHVVSHTQLHVCLVAAHL